MAKLSPVFNDTQFDDSGNLLAGGLIYTYVADSATPLATYTAEDGLTAQTNPIVLNARGEVASPIWLTEGLLYKLRLFDSANNFIREFDYVAGVGDNTVTVSQWQSTGLTPTYISATSFSVPGDQTSELHLNRRIKANVTSGTVYGYISGSVYDGVSITTITVVLDSGSLDLGLSSFQVGIITATDTSLPQIPDFVKSDMIQDDAVIARTLGDSAQGLSITNGYILVAAPGIGVQSLAVKTKAGNDPTPEDPVLVTFRGSSLTDGNYYVRSITSQVNLSISTGSTLGMQNGRAATIQVLLIDNAGTVEMAVVNNLYGVQLSEQNIITTIAEGGAGAADSANVIYSNTARANVPYRVAASFTTTQATAGSWVTPATQISQISSPPFTIGDSWTFLAEQASTSGTSLTFTGIPFWATEIVVMFVGVSTNGTSDYMIQLGSAGGLQNTGYLGSASGISSVVQTSNFTTGFGVTGNVSANSIIHGNATILRESYQTSTWTHTSLTASSAGTITQIGAGSKVMTDTVTQLAVTTVGGVNTFDAGLIRVKYR